MIVKTINPVIINGVHESQASKYLSFDANGKPTNSAETKQFQDWLDAKHPLWLNGGQLKKGSGYGTFGKNTQKAWDNYGSEFKASISPATTTPTTPPATSGEPSKEEQIKKAKEGKVWDKAKGWVKSGKAKDFLAGIQASGGLKGIIGGLFGGNTGGGQNIGESFTSPPPPEPEKKGMSKGAKIGLAIGGAVALGLIIYFATRKRK